MGCSGRVRAEDIRPEQKWEFISLNDFHSTSLLNPFAYAYFWISLFISISVYTVDTFTAINLLVYDRWSSEIKPFIPFNFSKWIFSVCIIASWINLAFEHLRAMRVIKRGAVAESYLDSLAARLQCTRLGSGRGWRRFLVFAELTKSKKGAEYVALFVYFSFQSWIRIIFCQGPRQVINGLTLYSVFKTQYDSEQPNLYAGVLVFFRNIEILAEKDEHQVLILSGMVFTLVIWALGALSLFLAMLAHILFLWHYIPNTDGGLSRYCERKINTRLAKIVSVKVNKAIEEEERKRLKGDNKTLAKGDLPQVREATLPKIFEPPLENNFSNPLKTPLSDYSNSSIFGQQIERPGSRAATISSVNSYGVQAPFLSNSAEMGNSRSMSPVPSLQSSESRGFYQTPHPGTYNINASPSHTLRYGPGETSVPYITPISTASRDPSYQIRSPILNNSIPIARNPIRDPESRLDTVVKSSSYGGSMF